MAKLILTMNLLLMDNKAPDLIVAMILSLTLTILMILTMTMNINMRMKKSWLSKYPRQLGMRNKDRQNGRLRYSRKK